MKKIFNHIIIAISGILFFSLPIIAGIAAESGLIGLLLFGLFCYGFVRVVNSEKFNEILNEVEE